MTLLQLSVLAAIQGITEFLPISSSGHLALVPLLTDWPDQGLLMDIAVHMGSLLAVILYFRKDVARLLAGVRHIHQPKQSADSRLLWAVVIGTIPAVIVGFLAKDFISTELRSMEVIATTTLVFGIVLYIADKTGGLTRLMSVMPFRDAFIIGLAQIISLIPGTSRSGITMTAARFLGYERGEAARFSMLLSIPITMGAGVLGGIDVYKAGDLAMTQPMLIAMAMAFVTALAAIAVLMRWLRTCSFSVFAVYRVILGGGLLLWLNL